MPLKISNKISQIKFAEALPALALFIITGIMPLVVRINLQPMPSELVEILGMPEFYNNAFGYWKSWFLIWPIFIVVLYFISDALTGARKPFNFTSFIKQPQVIAVLVYLFLVILSGLFSAYKSTAWMGTYERNEGILAQTAYIAAFIITMQYVRNPQYVKPVLYGLIFSSLVMGAIGVGQFFGRDIFATGLSSLLVAGDTKGLDMRFADFSYGTLINPNTFGLYTAMFTPFLFIAGFGFLKIKKIPAILLILSGAFMLTGVFGSRSLGGFTGFIAAVAVLAVTYIYFSIYHKKKPPVSACIALSIIITGAGAAFVLSETVNQRVMHTVNRFKAAVEAQPHQPDNYIFDGDTLIVTTGEGVALMSITYGAGEDWLTVKDGSGNITEPREVLEGEDEIIYHYDLTDYHAIEIVRKSDHFIFLDMYLARGDDFLTPIMPGGVPINIREPIPSFGFEGREDWGTARGYIWSRSFPLMLDHVFIGYGSDSFISAFPQYDVVGKLRFLHNPYVVVDKAHNLYIQTWICTGGLSFLALAFLLGHYLKTTFVSIIRCKHKERFSLSLQWGLLATVTAFCVASISTDSTIGTTGVFYVLLGLGYAVNKWQATTEKTATPAQ